MRDQIKKWVQDVYRRNPGLKDLALLAPWGGYTGPAEWVAARKYFRQLRAQTDA